ncbi:modular polyketide synthase domain protein [Burkholderia pseudomallei TSV5]|nr:modular polyketide synthase domain protein [Burkholderia pseudomallei TSV5]
MARETRAEVVGRRVMAIQYRRINRIFERFIFISLQTPPKFDSRIFQVFMMECVRRIQYLRGDIVSGAIGAEFVDVFARAGHHGLRHMILDRDPHAPRARVAKACGQMRAHRIGRRADGRHPAVGWRGRAQRVDPVADDFGARFDRERAGARERGDFAETVADEHVGPHAARAQRLEIRDGRRVDRELQQVRRVLKQILGADVPVPHGREQRAAQPPHRDGVDRLHGPLHHGIRAAQCPRRARIECALPGKQKCHLRHEIAFAHHQCRTARCRSVECPPSLLVNIYSITHRGGDMQSINPLMHWRKVTYALTHLCSPNYTSSCAFTHRICMTSRGAGSKQKSKSRHYLLNILN